MHQPLPADGGVPIGVVAAATGLEPSTMRVWERRYGFPRPTRRPSGRRLYTQADVERLRQIARALAAGLRAGQVVPAPPERLQAMLARALATPEAASDAVTDLLRSAQALDAAGLRKRLHRHLDDLGIYDFLSQVAAPLLEEIGARWERGEIEIHHEHLVTEGLRAVLWEALLSTAQRPDGPRVLLATLRGERHGLGLLMAAIWVAGQGGQPRLLGTDLPPRNIAQAARSVAADAVALSIAACNAGPDAAGQLAELRRALPDRVRIWIGGAGARRLRRHRNTAERVLDLAALGGRLQKLRAERDEGGGPEEAVGAATGRGDGARA